jgi:hypothetical protein
MKLLMKLEELSLLILFSVVYFYCCNGTWVLCLSLFFVPDISFVLYLFTKKIGAIAYNIFHHRGTIAIIILLGLLLNNQLLIK